MFRVFVAHIKVGGAAAKVRFAHMVIGADHAMLKDRKEVSAVLCLNPPVVTYSLALWFTAE